MTTERVGETIGAARASRLKRGVLFVLLLAVDAILLVPFVTLAVVFFVIDLVWGVITNDPVDEDGLLGWLTVLFRWLIAIHHHVLFGDPWPGWAPRRRSLT